VPTHDEQRIRNTHYSRITCNDPGCPGQVRHVDSPSRLRRHTRGNEAAVANYSRPFIPGRPADRAGARQPWRIQLSDGSDSGGAD